MIKLGPFELIEPLGSGGMGDVWRGRHLRQEVPVAIKLVRGEVGESTRALFEREVQAHAALSHPGVVYLFDYGVVSPEAAAQSEHLKAGAPYLAMELAEGGTLRELMPLSDWNQARALIAAILETLAHTHAREVIHRDLKPENILLFEAPNGLQPKLADFGIAHALRTEHSTSSDELSNFSGTPFYMPPEQAHGDWRSYGPWTDIYALGCVIWEMLSGQAPFGGTSIIEVVHQHCNAARPTLTTHADVPADLQDWLHRMIAISPEARFQSAAQALHFLPQPYEHPNTSKEFGADASRSTPRPTQMNWPLAEAETELLDKIPTRHFGPDHPDAASLAPTLADLDSPANPPPMPAIDTEYAPAALPTNLPLPSSWRRPQPVAMADPLIGAGLGLFGLREIPFVNRDTARDVIWQALEEVLETRQMRVILLVGGPGSGKSSLAEFMATRADEAGVVQRFLATHSPGGGNTELDGLPGAWRRSLRTFGLSRLELHQHLQKRLVDPADSPKEIARWERRARALTEWLEPAPPDSAEEHGPRHEFSSSTERYILARRVLERLLSKNAALLTLDDLQWGPDSLSALEYLLQSAHPDPAALVLVTLRADVLAEDPALNERITNLSAHPKCKRIDLSALEPFFHRELIGRMLHLEQDLLEEIALKTEGNPLFVTQLLRHLIDRDQLEVGAEGFRLVADIKEVLPPDIFALWAGRIDRMIDAYPPEQRADVRDAIELAAALGRQVNTQEWKAACQQASLTLPTRLVARMRARGLAQHAPGGFAFAHGLLVDSLARRSGEAGRWRTWKRHCAQMLTDAPHISAEASAMRRAEYWLAAGEYQRAIGPLISAGKREKANGVYAQGVKALQLAEATLDRIDAPKCDPRRIEIWLEFASKHYFSGNNDAVTRLLDDAQSCLDTDLDAPYLQANVFLARSWLPQRNGQARQAISYLESARERFHAINHADESVCLRNLAECYLTLGDYPKAHDFARQALAVAVEHDLPLGSYQFRLSQVLYMLGRHEASSRYLQTARAEFEDNNSTVGLISIENHAGELARKAGRLEEAAQHYRRFFEFCNEAGREPSLAVAQINIGLVLFALGEHQEAEEVFDECLRRSIQIDYHITEYIALCGLAATRAAQHDWPGCEAATDQLLHPRADHDHVYPDAAELLSAAGRSALEASQITAARALLKMADAQWRRIGNAEALAKTQALLEQL